MFKREHCCHCCSCVGCHKVATLPCSSENSLTVLLVIFVDPKCVATLPCSSENCFFIRHNANQSLSCNATMFKRELQDALYPLPDRVHCCNATMFKRERVLYRHLSCYRESCNATMFKRELSSGSGGNAISSPVATLPCSSENITRNVSFGKLLALQRYHVQARTFSSMPLLYTELVLQRYHVQARTSSGFIVSLINILLQRYHVQARTWACSPSRCPSELQRYHVQARTQKITN